MATKRHHRSCSHARYRMTCGQFDALWEAVQGRCQICGRLFRYSPAGRACIDHDHRIGDWAVRGLLCDFCNHNMAYRDAGRDGKGVTGPEVDAYLANPWYASLPYASMINPRMQDALPAVDRDTAVDLLRRVAAEVEDARRRRLSAHPGLVQGLLSTIRWAHRQSVSEVSMADIETLPRSIVYFALQSDGLQPRFPPPEPGPGDCARCRHNQETHRRAWQGCIGSAYYITPYGEADVPCVCQRFRAPGGGR